MVPSEQRFDTFDDWVDNASTVLTEHLPSRSVCVDAKGRRCRIGADFMRARDEGAFPVLWYWPWQIPGAKLDCVVSDVMVPAEISDEPPPEGDEDDRTTRLYVEWLLRTDPATIPAAAPLSGSETAP